MAFSLADYMAKYREDHQHPVNKRLHTIGIPMIVVSIAVLPFNPLLAAVMFVVGWILQFVGHAFEGKMPSFFSDPKFLMIGPLWFVKKITGRGKPVEDAAVN